MATAKRKTTDSPSDTIAESPSTSRKKARADADGPNSTSANDPSGHSPPLATPNLHALLDFSTLHSESVISQRFDEIARTLLHEYHLVVAHDGVETAFEIQEMEFYLQKAGCHEDPFTHGSEEQSVSGRWYFHRAPRRSADASRSLTSLTAYRGGSRKGLDLTIGNPLPAVVSSYFGPSSRPPTVSDRAEQESRNQSEERRLLRGGILLRSLRGLSSLTKGAAHNDSKSISGPSLLVDKILELSGAPSITELVENMWGGDTAALNPPPPPSSSSPRTSFLYLKHVANHSSKLPQIHKSPRIGLDLSHPGTTAPTAQSALSELHPRVRFLSKTYRYFTRPRELVKGRPQTFYGVICATLNDHPGFHHSLSGDKAFRDILTATMGVKDSLVQKYLVEYEAGKKDGLKHLKACIGPKGKGAADSPTSYLKMMGALEAVVSSARSNNRDRQLSKK